jgi:flagellar basal body rod protein FlgF
VADVQEDCCSIQVSNVEVLDGIPRSDVKRIAKWDEIEVGDRVKVKEQDSRLYYEAEVVSHNENGTYKVHFAEVDEAEDNVAADRMLKLMSGRLEDKEWMMYKETEQE